MTESISDRRRLTHKTLYISGTTGGDGPSINETQFNSWSSRFCSIFCGRSVNKKSFNSKDKMQFPVAPVLISNVRIF